MIEVEVNIRGGCCTHVAVTDEQGEPVEFTLNLIDYDNNEDADGDPRIDSNYTFCGTMTLAQLREHMKACPVCGNDGGLLDIIA